LEQGERFRGVRQRQAGEALHFSLQVQRSGVHGEDVFFEGTSRERAAITASISLPSIPENVCGNCSGLFFSVSASEPRVRSIEVEDPQGTSEGRPDGFPRPALTAALPAFLSGCC